ncbi:PREDICTED: intraflagellar transport protein 46 homolog [Haliaeetus leucocephalus]|uniref:intraflagellar transport protein 46 homolog n=1 Tax=Haliaeetus leucocephalus TaxID=52644 RepID=UPI00053CD48D|nr:PREDICTED: intraflagellar transport protein 46 homolog [Haliaeetus leucocephalus]
MAFPAFVQTAAANSTCGEGAPRLCKRCSAAVRVLLAPEAGRDGVQRRRAYAPRGLPAPTSTPRGRRRTRRSALLCPARPRGSSAGLRPGLSERREEAAARSAPAAALSEDEDDSEEEEDSSETDSEDDSEEHGAALEGDFNLADYDYLPVSSEIKELFEYIKRYTPKTIEIEHKLQPFIPDFIPAVGDIDAFLKVPRPDGKPDNLGLLVLDEPSTKQSDPTVLSLWLTENSKQHNITQQIKVKSLENAEKNPKAIDSWIESISELHRCKPPATVHYTRPMPDIETLMQEWLPEFEELLGKVGLPTADMNCDLAEYVDMICAILDIPVYKSRIQPLHVLFSLYSEFKNSQHFKALADGKKGRSPPSNPPSQAADAEVLSFT